MVPALDSMKTEMKDTAAIITINADENLKLMKEMRFYSLPYIMVFRFGKVVFQQDGFMNRSDMEALIKEYFYSIGR